MCKSHLQMRSDTKQSHLKESIYQSCVFTFQFPNSGHMPQCTSSLQAELLQHKSDSAPSPLQHWRSLQLQGPGSVASVLFEMQPCSQNWLSRLPQIVPLHLNLASGRISKVIYREVPVLSGAQLTDKAFPGSGALLCADAKLYKMPGSCIPEESYLYCIAIFSRRREIFEGAKQQLLEMIRQIHPTLQSCLCFP